MFPAPELPTMMFSGLKRPPSLLALTVSTTPGSRSARMARGTHCLSDTAWGGWEVRDWRWRYEVLLTPALLCPF